jgi:hypothetical protein
VRVLTHVSVVRTLRMGYPVGIHPSANQYAVRSKHAHIRGPARRS